MKDFEAILLDFGNVVINIDPDLTFQAFADLTGKTIENVKKRMADGQVFRRYETGLFSDDDFREIIRQTLGYPLNDYEIDKAWNALLLDVPYERIELVMDLRSKMPVYLLSNTSNIHIEACNRYFKEQFGIPTVSGLFDKTFYSYEMGLWKPENEIYHEVCKQTGFNAEKILFVDDNELNIAAAKDLNFNTIHLIPPDNILNHLKKYT